MVQKKVHKSKPKSQQARFKPKDGKELNDQLEALGLRIVQITADGNCLFRAVANQLEGNEDEHPKYRKMVVDYIEAHRVDYEPFLEDDVSFDEYCKNMREASTWAGHMELQVISLVTHTNICIHRLLFPRWHIQNFESSKAQCLHLSYHNGEHYNSVRRKDDIGRGPAKPILLETPSVMEERKESKSKSARMRVSNNSLKKIAEISAGTEQNFEEDDNADNFCNHSRLELDSGAPSKLMGSKDGEDELTEHGGDAASNLQSQQVQKIARNKACPCGSKKKYKACCGAVTSNLRAQEMASSLVEGLSNKARKQKIRNNKGVVRRESEPVIGKEPPDMGFLCI